MKFKSFLVLIGCFLCVSSHYALADDLFGASDNSYQVRTAAMQLETNRISFTKSPLENNDLWLKSSGDSDGGLRGRTDGQTPPTDPTVPVHNGWMVLALLAGIYLIASPDPSKGGGRGMRD